MEITYKSSDKQALWKSGISKVYLLHGDEDNLKAEAVHALRRHVVEPDFEDFDVETMDASSATSDAILSAAGQAPFGSLRRMVIVHGMEQWRERTKQGEADRLASGLLKLPDTGCLVLVVASEGDEARRKTAISTKIDAAVKNLGAIVACRALAGANLVDWVVEQFAREDKRISGETADELIRAVGNEMRPLMQEITKLVCYAGDRPTIGSSDIQKVVASSPDDVMFSAIDAITRRQTDRALVLLAEIHRYDPKPQAVAGKLLALLARQYRMLWQAKYLVERRISPRDVRVLPPDILGELPTEGNISQMAFKAGDLFAQSRMYSWDDIGAALECLLACDLANKGGVTDDIEPFGSDPAGNLQLLVLQLTGAYGSRR